MENLKDLERMKKDVEIYLNHPDTKKNIKETRRVAEGLLKLYNDNQRGSGKFQLMKCDQCDYETKNKEKYKSHIAKHNSTVHMCSLCNSKFKSLKILEKHEKEHEKEREKEYEKEQKERKELEEYNKKHAPYNNVFEKLDKEWFLMQKNFQTGGETNRENIKERIRKHIKEYVNRPHIKEKLKAHNTRELKEYIKQSYKNKLQSRV